MSLPDDLVTDILERLPIKSLVRFRCVSKSWCSLFKDPVFIKNHCSSSKQTCMLLMSRCLPRSRSDSIKQGLLSFHDLDFPETQVRPSLPIQIFKDLIGFQRTVCSFFIVGSCNGIVCVSCSCEFILCNPALREFKSLPLHNIREHLYTGFGTTSSRNDFKVILMLRRSYGEEKLFQPYLKAQLYSLRTNSWRRINDAPGFSLDAKHSVFLKSSCHWLVYKYQNHLRSHRNVLCFDLDTEMFREFELPDCVKYSLTPARVVVFNEFLGFVGDRITTSSGWELWVMKEYGVTESWTKQFVVHDIFASTFLPWKNHMLMVNYTGLGLDQRDATFDTINDHHDQLRSVSLWTKKEKNFQVHGAVNNMCMVIHEDSIVSLK